MAYHHFCCIFLVTQTNTGGNYTGCEYQQAGIIGGYIAGWLPY